MTQVQTVIEKGGRSIRDEIITHPFFHGMRPEHLELLTTAARLEKFAPGEYLFHESEPANRFFLIQKGKISIEALEPGNATVHLETLNAGDVLGWSWLFPPFQWHFQAKAVGPVETIVLDGGHLLVTAETNRDFGYELMKRLAHVVIERMQCTRKQLVALQLEEALQG